jgi:Ferritin-like domain
MTGETTPAGDAASASREENGKTRAQALRAALSGGALVGAGALAGGWANPDNTVGRPSPALDVRILNFLLVLEELQAAFYAAALRADLSGELMRFARTVEPQEREHVGLLRNHLGGRARPAPRFDVARATSDAARFQAAAIRIEEATAAAYIGQGASLTRNGMRAATRIVAVEARHAAWIRDIAGADPAPRAADPARSADDVLSDLRREGFMR